MSCNRTLWKASASYVGVAIVRFAVIAGLAGCSNAGENDALNKVVIYEWPDGELTLKPDEELTIEQAREALLELFRDPGIDHPVFSVCRTKEYLDTFAKSLPEADPFDPPCVTLGIWQVDAVNHSFAHDAIWNDSGWSHKIEGVFAKTRDGKWKAKVTKSHSNGNLKRVSTH